MSISTTVPPLNTLFSGKISLIICSHFNLGHFPIFLKSRSLITPKYFVSTLKYVSGIRNEALCNGKN